MASSGSSFSTSSRTNIHASSVTSGHHPNPIDPNEVAHEFRFFRVYKDGRIEKFRSTEKIPPSDDPVTGFELKTLKYHHNPLFQLLFSCPRFVIRPGNSRFFTMSTEVGSTSNQLSFQFIQSGESAGGNISHNLAVRIGTLGLPGVNVAGMVLVHPYFGGTDDDQMWLYLCPSNGGLQDPRLKPSAEDLARLGSKRVLIFVVEKDHLNVVGRNYY
ncbi:hypothetical protein Pint_34446 [Pistacia integerrima]|uniref:Uncharacterized protein n=1 Tax=Pistacia integerrima TaxID=434235 RepID=A0ACC0X6A1_9ROSI|nr:hypothetical protein Pint_34446 [Pistacia integerrima]